MHGNSSKRLLQVEGSREIGARTRAPDDQRGRCPGLPVQFDGKPEP
jgi:hypothetical protein